MKESVDPRVQAFHALLWRLLPFADVATKDLPLPRLLRLSLFQFSVGMAVVLLNGTLNRVMVVELGMHAWLVALMVSLPLVFAPLRALVGHRSDYHRSAFGLRRVPYIWLGTLLQFGGFAIMPFALLVLSDPHTKLAFIGHFFGAIAFLITGAGLHTTQTAGLALATDLSSEDKRPRVVALLYVMLLVGMLASALLFGQLLVDFTPKKLIQVVQGVAVATIVLNLFALWKQEAIDMKRATSDEARPSFLESWREFIQGGHSTRLLLTVGLGTAGFSMQDILLEPYGGQVLGLTVAQTTALTALSSAGTLIAFALAARVLTRGSDPLRLAAYGALIGVGAFAAVIFSAPLGAIWLFRLGTALIGFGAGLLGVGTLTAAMNLAHEGNEGLALGAWGAVQATAAGAAIAAGGFLKDLAADLGGLGAFGSAGHTPAFGYVFVYHFEIVLLITAAIVVAPLALQRACTTQAPSKIGLTDMP